MMKKLYTIKQNLVIVILLTVFTSLNLTAQVKTINTLNTSGIQGIQVENQNKAGLSIQSNISSFNAVSTSVEGKELITITTTGVVLQNEEGAPNIPSFSRYIAVPVGAEVSAKIISKETISYSNMDIAPSPVIPKDDDNTPLKFEFNHKIYKNNGLYPSEIVEVSSITKIRGVDVAIIAIHPFQYNPVTDELLVHSNLSINIDFIGGTGEFGENRLRSRWWDPIIKDAVINPEVFIEQQNTASRSTNQTGCEYLIVVPDNDIFIAWADSLKNFRNQQGILTHVVTTTEIGGNTVNSIESYINNAYNTWDIPPAAVLLMGDYNEIISPIYNNYCASDNIYADVDNDHMPDIVFARMTAQNESHLETFVTKAIHYEKSPPTNPDFYNNPITALGWQTERWFQICSETVGGYFKHVKGKDPVRINAIYDGNPDVDPWSYATNTSTVLNYFGPNGLGYIPATPNELGGWSGGSAADVNNALNSGAFILQHRDHGYEQGWGEPSYNSNSINGLTNTDLSFIFSINCLTGKYNIGGECFAEKFHRYKYNGENAGALGLIAASEVSYSFVNDAYVWGMYDNMFPDFMPDYGTTPESRGERPAFGNAAGKYFLQQSAWPYNTGNKEVTYNLFHHHGDAFTVLYSEVPQNLTVVHDQGIVAGEMSFTVTADEGSFIALTVNNEIIGTADGIGEPVSIEIPAQFPPDQILVTVTKQNYYRYSSLVNVIPPEGPYVIYNDISIENTTGQMTTGEITTASLTIKNIGVEEGNNISVSISTSDTYITLTDDSEDYGSIAAGDVKTIDNGFGWTVADDIPDMHVVEFEVVATDGDDVWQSKMFINAHAPTLSIGSMEFDDAVNGNGNGRLDAGETVDVMITTFNEGSSVAIDAFGTLSCNSSFITINTSQQTVGAIAPNGSEIHTFPITVDENTPIGTLVEFEYLVEAGMYSDEKTFNKKAGLVIEDWETGGMEKFAWATGGNANWMISTENTYEGEYCNMSGELGHSQLTWMSLIYEAAIDDSISFYYKVSSEDGYDFLRFFIDGAQKMAVSGEVGWDRASFPVSAGTHLFKWQYTKDYSETGGQDRGWVDYITLPTPPITMAYAGPDADYCESEMKQCYGESSNVLSVKWTTSGTGSFNNSQINTPVYYSSDEDIEAGSVVLSFTANGPIDTITDEVVFSFMKQPEAFAGNNFTACTNDLIELSDATALNYAELSWTTNGDGEFNDNTSINPIYTPGSDDINNGNAILTLQAVGDAPCGIASDDIEIEILVASSAFAGEDADICPGLTYHITDAVFENYDNLIWTTSGDGTFDDATSINPIYTPGNDDIDVKEVVLSASASNDSGCPVTIDEMTLTLNCTDIVENQSKNEIEIYPNPNNGVFNIKTKNMLSKDATIVIFNSLGNIVYSEKPEISEFVSEYNFKLNAATGVYSIQIEDNGKITRGTFIIK